MCVCLKVSRICVWSALLAVCGAAFWLFQKVEPSSTIDMSLDETVTSLPSTAQVITTKLPPAAREPEPATLLESAPLPQTDLAQRRAVAERINESFQTLWSQREKVLDRERLWRQTFDELAHTEGAIASAQALLLDPGEALAFLGEDQAVARVLAIQFLAHLGKNGAPEHLQGAITGLMARFAVGSASDASRRDIEDMVQAYAALDVDAFMRSPQDYLATLQFNPEFKREFGRAILKALDRDPREEVASSGYWLLREHVYGNPGKPG